MTATNYFQLFLDRRQLTRDDIRQFDNPSYDRLKDIDVLASALESVRLAGDKIVVLPDFDMDGIASAVVGVGGLSVLGFNVGVYTPDPSNGYGITRNDIDLIQRTHPDVKTIITCDVGITALDAIKYARDKGLSVLVTDHHKQLNSIDMTANVVVNPMRLDETYSHPAICGAFVFWQVLDYYAQCYQPNNVRFIEQLKLFAGIGTISDMMPLRYENRQLVRDSLTLLQAVYNNTYLRSESVLYNNCFDGMREFIIFLAESDKYFSVDKLNEEFYGFTVAPTFNSLKRLNGDIRYAFSLFFEPQLHARTCLEVLTDLNNQRKALVKDHYATLVAEERTGKQPYAPLVYLSDAPAGVLGLLANTIMIDNHLPTVVLNKTTLSGSGRSPVWYPFNTRLNQAGFFVAGHEGAFGTHVSDYNELVRYVQFLQNDVTELYHEADAVSLRERGVSVNTELPDLYLSTYDLKADDIININKLFQFHDDLKQLEPFGNSWTKPVVKLTFRPSDCSIRQLGKNREHLKLIFDNGFEILMWHASDRLDELNQADYLTCSGSIGTNTFRNTTTLNMMATVEPYVDTV